MIISMQIAASCFAVPSLQLMPCLAVRMQISHCLASSQATCQRIASCPARHPVRNWCASNKMVKNIYM